MNFGETNELLRQLIAQQGGEQPTIQLNIDGKKVGQGKIQGIENNMGLIDLTI